MILVVALVLSFAGCNTGKETEKEEVYTIEQIKDKKILSHEVYIKRGDEFYPVKPGSFYFYLFNNKNKISGNIYYYDSYEKNIDDFQITYLYEGDEIVVFWSMDFETKAEIEGPYIDSGDYTIGAQFADKRIYGMTTIFGTDDESKAIGNTYDVLLKNKIIDKDGFVAIELDEFFKINNEELNDNMLVDDSGFKYLKCQKNEKVKMSFMNRANFTELEIIADIKVFTHNDDKINKEFALEKNIDGYSTTVNISNQLLEKGLYRFKLGSLEYVFEKQ